MPIIWHHVCSWTDWHYWIASDKLKADEDVCLPLHLKDSTWIDGQWQSVKQINFASDIFKLFWQTKSWQRCLPLQLKNLKTLILIAFTVKKILQILRPSISLLLPQILLLIMDRMTLLILKVPVISTFLVLQYRVMLETGILRTTNNKSWIYPFHWDRPLLWKTCAKKYIHKKSLCTVCFCSCYCFPPWIDDIWYREI